MIFLMAVAVSICLTHVSFAQEVDRESMKKQIVKCLDVKIVDPDSAKIKYGPYIKNKDGKNSGVLCVLVNSKNKMGGYTGYQHGFFFFEAGVLSCGASSFDQQLRRVIGSCEGVDYE